MAFTFAAAPLAARGLGVEGRGVSSALVAITLVAPVLIGLGVPLAAQRWLGGGQSFQTTVTSARRVVLLGFLPSALAAIGVDALIGQSLPTSARLAFGLCLAATPLAVSWTIDAHVLLSSGAYFRMGLLAVIQAAVYFVVIFVLWVLSAVSIATVLYASLLSVVISFIAGRLWVRVERGGRAKWRDMGRLIGEGATMVGGRLADVAARRIDQIIAVPVLGASGAGIYAIAITIGGLAYPISQSVGASAFRAVAGEKTTDFRERLQHSSALSVLGAVPLLLIAYPMLPVLFGTEFAEATKLLPYTVLGSVVVNTNYVASMMLSAMNRGWVMTASQVAGVLVGLFAFVVIGDELGPVGGAIGIMVGNTVTLVCVLGSLRLSPFHVVPTFADFRHAVPRVLSPDPQDLDG